MNELIKKLSEILENSEITDEDCQFIIDFCERKYFHLSSATLAETTNIITCSMVLARYPYVINDESYREWLLNALLLYECVQWGFEVVENESINNKPFDIFNAINVSVYNFYYKNRFIKSIKPNVDYNVFSTTFLFTLDILNGAYPIHNNNIYRKWVNIYIYNELRKSVNKEKIAEFLSVKVSDINRELGSYDFNDVSNRLDVLYELIEKMGKMKSCSFKYEIYNYFIFSRHENFRKYGFMHSYKYQEFSEKCQRFLGIYFYKDILNYNKNKIKMENDQSRIYFIDHKNRKEKEKIIKNILYKKNIDINYYLEETIKVIADDKTIIGESGIIEFLKKEFRPYQYPYYKMSKKSFMLLREIFNIKEEDLRDELKPTYGDKLHSISTKDNLIFIRKKRQLRQFECLKVSLDGNKCETVFININDVDYNWIESSV